VAAPAAGQAQAEQKPRPKPPTVYRVAAGDLDGDGRDEVLSWDSESKELKVSARDGESWKVLASHELANHPGAMVVADIDGDGTRELVIGEGLRGYNPKEGAQTDVHLRVYHPLAADGWKPAELYRKPSERPEVTTLEVTDVDGDGAVDILLAYFSSKYFVDIVTLTRRDGEWRASAPINVRMGPHVDAGKVTADGKPRIVVGRPYGEPAPPAEPAGSAPGDAGKKASTPPTVVGDAFVLDGSARLELPVRRGVSSVEIGDLTGDGTPEIVVADGWHSDFGKIARGRLAVLTGQGSEWEYELIEDVPQQIRMRDITLADVNGDGQSEILARGDRRSSLGGAVRLYQRTPDGWRGATLAPDVQDFAVATLDADRRPVVVLAGAEPKVVALDLATLAWDAKLAEAVNTYKIDHTTLVGKPAPALLAQEWLGGPPLALDALKGKVALLDFWATWCKPCIAQFPTMRAWQEKFGSDLVILGITNLSSQTQGDVRAFAEKQQLPWALAIDADDRTHMDYGVSPIPHSFVIDRQGIVRLTHVGGGDLEKIEAAIADAVRATP
jgi:peroxiredoxin